MRWINAIIQGVLVGGLYAMYATGLSITFGVMRLVNLAHGDAAIAAAFVASTIMLATGWNAFATLVILLPLAFLTGVVVQRVAFDRLVGVDPSYQIVATFGLAIIIQNVLLERYSGEPPRPRHRVIRDKEHQDHRRHRDRLVPPHPLRGGGGRARRTLAVPQSHAVRASVPRDL